MLADKYMRCPHGTPVLYYKSSRRRYPCSDCQPSEDNKMTCLDCLTDTVPMPTQYGQDTTCSGCGQVYALMDDLGWWSYSCEIYTKRKDSNECHKKQ